MTCFILSNQAVKKGAAPKKAMVKKDVKSKVAAKNGCDGRLMVKILIATIQVNLMPRPSGTNSPELSLLKFLPLTYHHSHSWPPPWISHLFSPWPFWGPHLFLQLGCF